jgi:chorismate dehydratase
LFEVILHENNSNKLERKIRVAAVSYLNTKPLIYGFEKGMMKDEIELLSDFPAKIANMLLQDEVDIALIPVAAIPQLKEHYIITDYCIGTIGEVASVCLFSDVPLEEIETVLLDYQSKSSVGLLRILLKEHWAINPKLVFATEGYEKNIEGTTAGLVIGDRAFLQRPKNRYIYDLGTAWKEMTGLPFVFAAWVANKKLDNKFIEDFNKASGFGFQYLPEIIAANPYEQYDLQKYYTENISFVLDDAKRMGLDLYFKKMQLRTVK